MFKYDLNKNNIILCLICWNINGLFSNGCPLLDLISNQKTPIEQDFIDKYQNELEKLDSTYLGCVHDAALEFKNLFSKDRRNKIKIFKLSSDWDIKNNITNDSIVSKKFALLGAYQKADEKHIAAINNLNIGLTRGLNYYKKDDIEIQKINQNLAESYYLAGNTRKTKFYLDSAYSKFEKHPFHKRKSRSFKFYAKHYARLGDSFMFELYNLAYKCYLEKFYHGNIADYYFNILRGLYTMEENSKIHVFLKELEDNNQIINNYSRALLYHNILSPVYFKLNMIEKALFHRTMYGKLLEKDRSDQNVLKKIANQVYILEAELTKEHDSKKELEIKELYHAMYDLASEQNNPSFLRISSSNLFSIYLEEEQYEKSYNFFKKLENLVYKKKATTFSSHDYELRFFLEAFDLLSSVSKTKNDPSYLNEAFELVGMMDSISTNRINNFISEDSSLDYLDPKKNLYLNAIKICYELFELTNSQKYVRSATRLIEQNKSIILLNNARQKINKATLENTQKENNIIDSLELLKKTIADSSIDLEIRLVAINKMHEHVKLLQALRASKRTALKIEFQDLDKAIKTPKNTLQFFTNENLGFRIYINDKNQRIDKIYLTGDLTNSLQEYILSIEQPTIPLQNSKLKYISEKLLPHDLKTEEPLTIIPDGLINYIPFETLKINNTLLIHKVTTNYAYSLRHLQTLNKLESSHNGSFISFAPSYSQNKDLEDLTFNTKEITAIQKHYSYSSLHSGESANLQAFQKSAPNSQVIHIAAHAKADTSEAGCQIYFTADNSNYTLSLDDIYKMNIQAELVTLSACETADGEVFASEGVLSLGRGFAYAGAKAVVSSLWSANDMSTSMIMSSFYKFLNEGQRKDEALRNAKLEYLNDTDSEYHHAYYWAAFIPMGDMSPLTKDQKVPWWYGALALAFGAGGIGFTNSLKKTRSFGQHEETTNNEDS